MKSCRRHIMSPGLFVCLLFITSQAMARLQPIHKTKSVAEWQAEATSSDEKKRILAIRCLGFYGREAEPSIPTLRACLSSPNPRVKGTSLDALVMIYKSGFEHGSDSRAEGDLIRALESNLDPIRVLLALESSVTDKSLPSLTAALKNSDVVVRYFAVMRIERLILASTDGRYGGVGEQHRQKVHTRWKKQADVCMSSLIATAEADNPSLARAAVQALGAFGWYESDIAKPAVSVLIASLNRQDRRLVRQAVDTLSRIGVPAREAVPALTELARREAERMASGQTLDRSWGISDWAIQSSCLVALGSMGHHAGQATPLILKAMVDEDEQIRSVATSSLEQVGVIPEAVPILAKNLRDPHPKVRHRSAAVLAKCGKDAAVAVPALTEALSDADKMVRFCAAMALRDLAEYSNASLPALQERLDDEDKFVRTIVCEAITAIEKHKEKTGANKTPATKVSRCLISRTIPNSEPASGFRMPVSRD